jgi:hypothetical protein
MEAIVVLPGWFTDKPEGEWHDIPLANEKSIPKLICGGRRRLSNDEIARITKAIGEHLREQRSGLLG